MAQANLAYCSLTRCRNVASLLETGMFLSCSQRLSGVARTGDRIGNMNKMKQNARPIVSGCFLCSVRSLTTF